MYLRDIPQIREVGNLEFLAKQLVEGFITGLHRSPFHGFSVEFAEHRLYNSGESTRHIDWKVFAKTDRLYVKQYEEETNLRTQLVLDISSSMFYPEENFGKMQFSVLCMASLAYMLQKQKDAFSLCTFDTEIQVQTQTKSTTAHLYKIFTLLEQILTNKIQAKSQKTNLAHNLDQIAEKIHKRSLVIILSDMLENVEKHEEIFSALQHLKHNKHEVLFFHIRDTQTEDNLVFENRPHIFTDVETGEKVRLQPDQIQQYYQSQRQNHFQNLKLKCAQYKIDLIEVNIAQTFEQVLYAYMTKRQKMK
jgi:uncharacterized protein (DUF58 family)